MTIATRDDLAMVVQRAILCRSCDRQIAEWVGNSIMFDYPNRHLQIVVPRGEVHIICPRTTIRNGVSVYCGSLNILVVP